MAAAAAEAVNESTGDTFGFVRTAHFLARLLLDLPPETAETEPQADRGPVPWQRRWSTLQLVPAHLEHLYYHVIWGLSYAVIVGLFIIASSPLIGSRRQRFRWHPYTLSYSIASMWVLANFVGHTRLRVNLFGGDLLQPASMLMPVFWSSLFILLGQDMLLLGLQHVLRRLVSVPVTFSWQVPFAFLIRWGFEHARSKFRISFGRTFSEAATSSFTVAMFCCLMHDAANSRQVCPPACVAHARAEPHPAHESVPALDLNHRLQLRVG
jgi:hypothetical protein